MSPDPSRLQRELSYYRHELKETGATVIRLQEEQRRLFLDLQRSRLVAKLVRELYRISDLDASTGTLPRRVLEVVVEHAMCDCAALLRERPLGSGAFAVFSKVGVVQGEQTLQLRKAPPFLFTTSGMAPDPHGSAIVAWMGVPYVLWTQDPSSGFALLLGNKTEGNANRPFGAGDQELIETCLTVFLDAWARSPRSVAAAPNHESADPSPEPGDCEEGLEVSEISQQRRQGGRVLGLLVVERQHADNSEYAVYLNVSWEHGWRVLRRYRGSDDRTWRDFDRLLPFVRSDLGFDGAVTVYGAGTEDLGRFPAIASRERLHQQGGLKPMPMSFASSVGAERIGH